MEVATEMSSSMYEPTTAKKVYLYRNGAINSDPKCLIVNQRQVRDFGTFLSRVTSGLKAPVAIRNIYTPAGGHKVKSLDSLESGRYYVAGGSEQFKKIKYGGASPQKLLTRRPTRKELHVPTRVHQAVVASARYKKPVDKPFVIHVFRNGDFRYRGARVLLPRRIMGSWEHVLEIVTEKADLFTPAKRLCTLDGHIVHAVSELQDGGKYVAIEGTKPFQRVSYCANDDSRSLMHTFPKAAIRFQRVPRRRPLHHAIHQDAPGDTVASDPGKASIPPPSLAVKQQRRDKRKGRPMAGRKNKEAREKAIEDHRADSIFGGSPTRDLDTSVEGAHVSLVQNEASPRPAQHPLSKREVASDADADKLTTDTTERKPGVFHASDNNKESEQKPPAKYNIEETQGETVFKAKAQRTDVEDAETVTETQDTEVERPLDMEEAQEVEDEEKEEFEGEGEAASGNKQVPQPQNEAQPLHASVDLSVNRTQQPAATPLPADATTQGQADTSSSAEEHLPPTMADQPQLHTGDSVASLESRHSEKSSSKSEGTNQKDGEAMDSADNGEETSTAQSERGDDEHTSPPEEVIEEDEAQETNEEDVTTIDKVDEEGAEVNGDVAEELEDEPVDPAVPDKPEQVEEETQVSEEEGDGGMSGGGEQEVAASPAPEPADTSVPEEEIAEDEVDTSVQDDTGSNSQKEDEPTTTFVIEDSQHS